MKETICPVGKFVENENIHVKPETMDIRRILMRVLVIVLGCMYLFFPLVPATSQEGLSDGKSGEEFSLPWWVQLIFYIVVPFITAFMGGKFAIGANEKLFKLEQQESKEQLRAESDNFNRGVWLVFANKIELLLESYVAFQTKQNIYNVFDVDHIKDTLSNEIKNDNNTLRQHCYIKLFEMLNHTHLSLKENSYPAEYIFKSRQEILDTMVWLHLNINYNATTAIHLSIIINYTNLTQVQQILINYENKITILPELKEIIVKALATKSNVVIDSLREMLIDATANAINDNYKSYYAYVAKLVDCVDNIYKGYNMLNGDIINNDKIKEDVLRMFNEIEKKYSDISSFSDLTY